MTGGTKSFLKNKKATPDSPSKGKASESGSLTRSPRGKLAKHGVAKKGKADRNKNRGSKDVSSAHKHTTTNKMIKFCKS